MHEHYVKVGVRGGGVCLGVFVARARRRRCGLVYARACLCRGTSPYRRASLSAVQVVPSRYQPLRGRPYQAYEYTISSNSYQVGVCVGAFVSRFLAK